MNKEFSDWYNSYPNGEPSYQETFEAGQAAVLAKLRAGVELPEPAIMTHLGTDAFTRDQVNPLLAARALAASKRENCTWTESDDSEMPGTYASSCGEMWSFIDGGVKENRVTYCHHCGGKVVLAASPHLQFTAYHTDDTQAGTL